MNAYNNEKGRQTKLLTAIAVLAMVICVFAAVMPSEVSAEELPEFNDDGVSTLTKDLTVDAVTLNEGQTLDLGKFELTVNGSITFNSGSTVKNGTINYNGTIQFGSAVAEGVTFNSTSATDVSMTTVVAGSSVKFTGCTFIGANCTTAIYANYSSTAETNLDVTDCVINPGDSSVREIIHDGPSNGTITITNSTGVSINVCDAEGTGAEITYGDDIVVTEGTLDRLNVNQGCTFIIPEGESLSVNTIRAVGYGTGTITVDGTLEVLVQSNFTDDQKGKFDGANQPILPAVASSNNDFSDAMDDAEVPAVTVNGNVTYNGPITKPVNVVEGGTLTAGEEGIVLSDATTKINVQGGTLAGVVSNNNNRMNFQNVQGDFVVTYGSVKVDGTITNGTLTIAGETEISGTIGDDTEQTPSGSLTINRENGETRLQYITLDGDLEILSGATLTIGEGVVLVVPENRTLTNNGTLTVNGAVALYNEINGSGTINGSGQYAVADGVTAPNASGPTQVSIYLFEDATGVSNTITGNTEWNTATYLTNDITIAYGATVTITRDGFLDLCGHDLIVKGTLIIDGRGYITDESEKGTIYLADTGSIQNNGVIGSGKEVTVQMYTDTGYNGTGFVTLIDVEGVSFDKERSVSGNTIGYTLTVTGDITYSNRESASIEFGGNVIITGETEIGRLVNATGAAVLGNGASLTISGTDDDVIRTVDIMMSSESTMDVNGTYEGTVSAKTGEFDTYTQAGAINVADTVLSTSSTIEITDFRGVTYTVSSVTYDVPADDGSNNTVSKTRQMLSVSGSSSYIGSNTDSGKMKITNDVYVLTEQTLTLADGVTFADDSTGTFVTEGILTTVNEEVDRYKGAMYSIENDDGDFNYTYTNFTDAFAQIANADDTTITLMGGYDFTGEIIVGEDQIIELCDSNVSEYNVDEDAIITIQDGGTIEGVSANSNFTNIYGILTVMDGGECVPPTSSYEVSSENDDGDITYSSAAVAIANAQSGTTVNIVGKATLRDPVTIRDGVTIEIADTGILTAQKGITVEQGGAIVNEGSLNIGAGYDLTVAGEVDSTEGQLSFGNDSELNVTGTVTTTAQITAVNGAYYTSAGEYVYTSVSNAVTQVSAMVLKVPITAVGTFSETGTVTLTQGMILNVNGSSITLGTIDMETGSTLNVSSGLTATVTGTTGEGTSAVDASVELSKAGNIRFAESYNNSNSTSTMTASAIDSAEEIGGTITVTAGNVTIGGTIVFDGEDGSLVIASGAAVTVPENSIVNAKADNNTSDNNNHVAVSVVGTMDVVEGTFDIDANSFVTVSGTVNVSESIATTGVVIDGTMTVNGNLVNSTVDDEEGRVVIGTTGVLIVGEKPNTVGATGSGVVSGAVTTGVEGGYIKAYNGADLSEAVLDLDQAGESQAESTAFYINGWMYMTVYSMNTDVLPETFLTDERFSLAGYLTSYGGNASQNITGVDITNVSDWYTDADMTDEAESLAIGNPEALYFKANYATVDVVISVGQGISLYIDNIRMTSGATVPLTVGTHTVTATVNPGFSGTTQIQFNGQAVTGGSFEITADMASAAYEGTISVTATGDITQDQTVINTGSSDDGMGLTDYLLIILVILIVVMAIIVALRLMRS